MASVYARLYLQPDESSSLLSFFEPVNWFFKVLNRLQFFLPTSKVRKLSFVRKKKKEIRETRIIKKSFFFFKNKIKYPKRRKSFIFSEEEEKKPFIKSIWFGKKTKPKQTSNSSKCLFRFDRLFPCSRSRFSLFPKVRKKIVTRNQSK